MNPQAQIYLVDNGSLAPTATFDLRSLATGLSQLSGYFVEPVSLLHSHKISDDALGGVPATIVKRRMREALAEGKRSFILLPLFLGPSRALSDYLPEVIEDLKKESGEFKAIIADPLAGSSVKNPDNRLAEILAQQVAGIDSSSTMQVALVDHGTPAPEVNQLRNAVAVQLSERLGRPVVAASMERRDGDAYAFNEPLLENLGGVMNLHGRSLLIAMFFLLPGRHAGPDGDVAEIAAELIQSQGLNSIARTELMGTHPLILEILNDRLLATLKK